MLNHDVNLNKFRKELIFSYLLTASDVTEEATEGDSLSDGGLQINIKIKFRNDFCKCDSNILFANALQKELK
jgi:hypothetical protein